MSPEREWNFRIQHIADAIDKIMRYTAGTTFEQFAADERTVDAVIRNFFSSSVRPHDMCRTM